MDDGEIFIQERQPHRQFFADPGGGEREVGFLIDGLPGFQEFHEQPAQQPPQEQVPGAEWHAVLPVRQVDHPPEFVAGERNDHEAVGLVEGRRARKANWRSRLRSGTSKGRRWVAT